MACTWFKSYTYMASEKKTLEQVQKEVDALTHTEFMKRVASVMATSSIYGTGAYYFGGALTENATLQRALVIRLARVNGDIELAKEYTKEFAARDAFQQGEAALVSEATRQRPAMLWVDAFSYQAILRGDAVSRAHVSTDPSYGCVPLRTLTDDELKGLGTTEL
jgi:hypothetical protein